MYPSDIGGMYEEPSSWPYYVIGAFISTIAMALLVNTIQSVFQRISTDLCSLSPAQIWIAIIPVFGGIWIFYVIWQLANALSEEFKRRKLVEFETSPGLGVGWAYAFFTATAQLTLLIDEPVITVLLFIVSTVLLIIYWTKIAAFKNKLDYNSLGKTQFHSPPPFPFQQQNSPPMPTQKHWPTKNPQYLSPQQPPKHDDWERWKPK